MSCVPFFYAYPRAVGRCSSRVKDVRRVLDGPGVRVVVRCVVRGCNVPFFVGGYFSTTSLSLASERKAGGVLDGGGESVKLSR